MNTGINPAEQSVGSYVLVTAAYNEEAYLETTIQSVIAQTVLPLRWVIVSDGSTDRTDQIVREYARSQPFIQLYRVTEEHPRDFSAQVFAINCGFAQIDGLSYDFVGNLDADITIEPTYFANLLERFRSDPGLGLAGGYVCERQGQGFAPRKTNSVNSVAHAVQLFRRECMDRLGGYLALPYGGPDWHAEVSARMNGWRVQSFPELPVHHHRPTGTAGGLLRYVYRQGHMDYSLGSDPLFELLKLARRIPSRPYLLGAFARLSGFLIANCCRAPRMVSVEFVRFLRDDQRQRLWLLAGRQRPVSATSGVEPQPH